ncbi:hypothetical protein BDP27DRAFT_1336120 [Rhodocollybia butyracea]|uniref:DUF6699 domain-containing protein n=1 Tax=Rhodocollybia butyracea TaxID=206335 RepID=A0A9P5PF92_9AGAR|nr:hypothetical protein BDP27DRAFT_1336120 [Rhodocollybia butyracea]
MPSSTNSSAYSSSPGGPPRAHRLLAYSRHPGINYDVSLPISYITTSYKGFSFSEPAVLPHAPFLLLHIPHHPWPISVHPSFNRQYVTAHDVFNAIYYSLRHSVTPSEMKAIPSRKDFERVRSAYEMRCRRFGDRHAYNAEKQKGVKRVDFLRGHTRFVGLAPSAHGAWILHLS